MTNEAILSSNGNYTLFSFNGYVIRFRTSSKLERYTKILEWENGYIAVTAKYKGLPEEEEYIDLVLVFDYNQEVIETSMDDIEIQIVFDYYNKNKKYMEV
mgnify:CR=1 FL=1